MYQIPYVIEDTGRGERAMDIYSRLLKDRIVFIGTEINDAVANTVIAQLLFLRAEDPKKDVNIYINSPGGYISAGLAIYDTMKFMGYDINTYCLGQAASMGALLLGAGTKGKRFALPNTEVMIHELSTGNQGKFNDIKLAFEHSQKLYEKMAKHYVEFTGQKLPKVKQDMQRDFYMNAEEAKEYGLIDEVLYKRS